MAGRSEKFKLDKLDARNYVENFSGDFFQIVIKTETVSGNPISFSVNREDAYYAVDDFLEDSWFDLEVRWDTLKIILPLEVSR